MNLDLPTMEVAHLPAFYPQQSAASRNATIGLETELKHARRADRHHHLHALHVANAAKHLDQLPAAGESLHIVMAGNFAGWDFVPAVLRLAEPATIAELHVATLGFNRRNAEELIRLIDEKQIGRCWFVCSVYYRTNEPEVFDGLHAELTARGSRMIAIRNHAKILLMQFTDGRCFTIESSANLRSCRNIEQCCITQDRALLDFHRGWIEEMFNRANT